MTEDKWMPPFDYETHSAPNKKQYTEQEVHDALDQALENGYAFKGLNAVEIGKDLGTYKKEFEGEEPEELAPFVQTWLDKQANG